MRLDHIAYRVADRNEAVRFFVTAFGYRVADEFTIFFDNGETARCFALEPPEKITTDQIPLSHAAWWPTNSEDEFMAVEVEAHVAPEIFVSDGTPDSIVGKWVAARNGVGGIHHLAYEVEDVAATMKKWKEEGWAEFTTEEPISNTSDLTQCFTKPHHLTGTIYEFIKRGKDNKGFNVDSVKDLMESTNGL